MKNCPKCSIPLTPTEYEGFGVLRCERCNGHLVDMARLDSIKGVARKTRYELKAEATAEFKGNNTNRHKCPRCRLTMSKQTARFPVGVVELDVCRSCSLVWLDGGELALVQLGYESSAIFAEAQEMKRRMAQLEASPNRKAAFEENLARLPVEPSPVEEAVAEIAGEMFEAIIRGCLGRRLG